MSVPIGVTYRKSLNLVTSGAVPDISCDAFSALIASQMQAPGLEMARSGRTFIAGTTLVAGGVIPVVDLPTTTGPSVLYNSHASRSLVIKRITTFYASGTGGAAGFSLFAGVTPSALPTALTANGATNFRTQDIRGSGATSSAFIDVAKTIPAGTAWVVLGGLVTLANTVMGPSFSVDVSGYPFVIRPTYALTVGTLSDLGTSAKFGYSIIYDENEVDLP